MLFSFSPLDLAVAATQDPMHLMLQLSDSSWEKERHEGNKAIIHTKVTKQLNSAPPCALSSVKTPNCAPQAPQEKRLSLLPCMPTVRREEWAMILSRRTCNLRPQCGREDPR